MSEPSDTQDRIWITLDRRVSDGNYGSIGVSAGMARTIPAGEDPEEARRLLEKEVLEFLTECQNDVYSNEAAKTNAKEIHTYSNHPTTAHGTHTRIRTHHTHAHAHARTHTHTHTHTHILM